MMESPGDSTAVIRMRRDFDAFISGNSSRMEQPSFRLNLNAEDFPKPSSKPSRLLSSEAIKNTLEKEKQERLRTAELLAAQSKIAELESQLTLTKTSNKRARIEYEKGLDSVRNEREHDFEKTTELRSKIRQLTDSEQQAKAELAEARKEWEAARSLLEGKLCTVQRERLTLEDDIQKIKEEHWQEIMDLKQESGRCLSELELMVIEMEETKQELESQKMRVAELITQLTEFEDLKQKAEEGQEKIKELEEQIAHQAEDAVIIKAMRADIDKVPGLEKEVSRLRIENEYWSQQKQNALLLQEQLTSVQRKLEMTEKRSQAFIELQVENEDLKSRLHRWEAQDTSGSRRPQSPSSLSKRVAELQAAEALSLDQRGQLQSSISVLELKLQEAKEQHQKTQEELTTQQLQVQQQNDLIRRLRRKLLLITKERDSFKGILDAYESDMTVPVPSGNRIKELMEISEGYQKEKAELEAELEKVSELHRQAAVRCLQLEHQCQQMQVPSLSLKVDKDKIGQLQENVLSLEQELEKVSREKEILEMRIEQRHLQGDYDPANTRILHLSMNPSAVVQKQRQQEIVHLKEENERLLARVQLLEQAGGPVEDLTLQVNQQLETVPESKVIEELKAQLATAELRKQRLLEAFKKTSLDFRQTCYQLLGYKIDMPCTGQYRLANMYSESPHDYLLFQQGQSGEIQMLETDFSGRQTDKLETYLRNRGSIPALLSAITLELFNQQTMTLSGLDVTK